MSHALQHRHAVVCDGKPVCISRAPAFQVLQTRSNKCQRRISASQHDADWAISQAVYATSASLVDRAFEGNWRAPLEGCNHPDSSCRPIVCLGKFDALHKGHQSLAAAALALGGSPVLLSFSGMGAVLGWQPRKPLVAPCDRPRVLNLWAQQLSQQQQQQQQRDVQGNSTGNTPSETAATTTQQPIRQHYIPFAAIRSMSPEAFVQLLQQELGAAGVVAGINYRFGYCAAGDSSLLQQLCAAAGLPSRIVELVGAAEPGAVGVVSSSKIREMLATCRIDAARKSLGRLYRLVAAVQLPLSQQQQQQHMWPADDPKPATEHQKEQLRETSSSSSRVANNHGDALCIPHEQLLNQHPGPGVYQCNIQLYLGATPHDDLLQLQTAAAAAAASAVRQRQSDASDAEQVSSGAGSGAVQLLQGLQVPGSSCCAAVTMRSQQVVMSDSEVMLPSDVLKLAAAALGNCTQDAGSSSSSSSSSSMSSTAEAGVSLSTSNSNSNSGSIGLGSHSSSSSTSSRQCDLPLAAGDPRCWDTDDNDDSSGSDVDESGSMQALLVLDFERCLQQTCSIQASRGAANTM